MENSEQVLVIILSVFLAIALLLFIIFLVLAIKVVKTVRRVSQKAEMLAEKAGAVGDFVQHATTPLIIGKIFSNIADNVFKRPGKSKRK